MRPLIAVGVLLSASIVAAEPLRVVATGDSITNGYGPRLGAALAVRGIDATVTIIASGGLTTPQYAGEVRNLSNPGLRDYAAEVVAVQPNVVLWMLGTNDAYWDETAAGNWADYQRLVPGFLDRFTAAGSLVVVGTPIPILRQGKEAANERLTDLYRPFLRHEAQRRAAEAEDRREPTAVGLLDLNLLIRGVPDWQGWYNDGIHLWADNAAGYAWMADQWAGAVERQTSAAPEPSTLAMLAGLALALVLTRSRLRA